MRTFLALTDNPVPEATSSRCPQCLTYARLRLGQPDPSHRNNEWRTFECEQCGLPRTFVAALFEKADFDPEEIELPSWAYEKARKSLHDTGQPPVVQQIIAERIIAAAKAGERDPNKLCETALIALGNKAVFEP